MDWLMSLLFRCLVELNWELVEQQSNREAHLVSVVLIIKVRLVSWVIDLLSLFWVQGTEKVNDDEIPF